MQPGPAPSADKERSDALNNMDLVKIVRAYLQQAIDEVPGYKGLLLDKDTMRICSTMYGRSEFADHSAVCIERIDENWGLKEHQELKVRPSSQSKGMGLLVLCLQRLSLLPRDVLLQRHIRWLAILKVTFTQYSRWMFLVSWVVSHCDCVACASQHDL